MKSNKMIVEKIKEMNFMDELKVQLIDTTKSCVVLDFMLPHDIEESIIIDKATMNLFIEAYILASKENKINDFRIKIMADV